MNNNQLKRRHHKFGGKRFDMSNRPAGKSGVGGTDAFLEGVIDSGAKQIKYFWKSKLPAVDEKEKLEIECPDYSQIPVYEDAEEKGLVKESTEGKTEIVGVRFRATGKVYYFLPYTPDEQGRINSLVIHTKSGDNVIVDTVRGMEFGSVFVPNKYIENEKLEPLQPMRSIIRLATEEDVKTYRENSELEEKAEKVFIELANSHKLPMKLIDIQYTFDRSKLLFYFSSEGRVDFRDLVKDLASVFHTRIELRQIGIRDEARIMGGLGACGRPLCCSSFLTDFVQVSIKMAKSQVMSLNPGKISGCCGRLMCCLRYENDTYEEEIKKTPPVDSTVKTEDGFGIVTEINPLAETVKVKLTDDKSDTRFAVYHRDNVTVIDSKDPDYLSSLESASKASAERAQKVAAAQQAQQARIENRQQLIAQKKIAASENMFAYGNSAQANADDIRERAEDTAEAADKADNENMTAQRNGNRNRRRKQIRSGAKEPQIGNRSAEEASEQNRPPKQQNGTRKKQVQDGSRKPQNVQTAETVGTANSNANDNVSVDADVKEQQARRRKNPNQQAKRANDAGAGKSKVQNAKSEGGENRQKGQNTQQQSQKGQRANQNRRSGQTQSGRATEKDTAANVSTQNRGAAVPDNYTAGANTENGQQKHGGRNQRRHHRPNKSGGGREAGPKAGDDAQ